MKKVISLAVALFTLLSATPMMAQDLVPDENEKGKWGFIDADGNKVIDYKYDDATGFVNGLAKVRKGNNYGYINPQNQVVIDIKYQEINPVIGANGLYKVAVGKVKDGVVMEAKYGFVNESGATIIKPEFSEITPFTDGIARVKKGDKYGFINDRYEFVIPCEYNAVGTYNSDGVVWVNKGCKMAKGSSEFTGGKFGLFDRNGNAIIPVKYGAIGSFQAWYGGKSKAAADQPYYLRLNYEQSGPHHAIVRTKLTQELFSQMPTHDGNGYYASEKSTLDNNLVLDTRGNVLIPKTKYHAVMFPEDGYARVYTRNKGYNYLNLSTNQLLLRNNVTDAYGFQDGVAVINTNGKYDLIDTNGNRIAGPYFYIFPRNDGVYVVTDGKLYGLLDSKGNKILECDNEVILSSHDGKLARQEKGGLFGYIDTTGKYVIEPQYKSARNFIHGYAFVKNENGWGALLPSGEYAVPCKWKDIYNVYEDNARYIWVTADDKLAHCFDTHRGDLAFPKGYTAMRTFGNDFDGIAIVWQGDGNIGCIDEEGNEIIPTELPSVDAVCQGYREILAGNIATWKPVHTYRIKIKVDPQRHKAKLFDVIDNKLWDY